MDRQVMNTLTLNSVTPAEQSVLYDVTRSVVGSIKAPLKTLEMWRN